MWAASAVRGMRGVSLQSQIITRIIMCATGEPAPCSGTAGKDERTPHESTAVDEGLGAKAFSDLAPRQVVAGKRLAAQRAPGEAVEVRSDRGANPSSVRNGGGVDGKVRPGGGGGGEMRRARRGRRCDGSRLSASGQAGVRPRSGRRQGWIALILSAIGRESQADASPDSVLSAATGGASARKRLNRDSRSPK